MFASYTQYISLVSLANYFALSPAKCAICEMVTCSYISSVVCENKQLFYFFFCCSTLPSIRNNFLLHPYKNVFYVLFFSHKLTPTSNHALLATIASSISSHFRYTHTQFLTDIDTQTMMLWTTEDIVWRDGRGIDYWGELWSIFEKFEGLILALTIERFSTCNLSTFRSLLFIFYIQLYANIEFFSSCSKDKYDIEWCNNNLTTWL